MEKKAIFLDVDGVLNSTRFAKRMFSEEGVRIYAENILDKNAVLCLKQIVVRSGADIIVSSTWRLSVSHFIALQDQLSRVGLTAHDITPRDPYRTRGYEIQTWLDNNPSYKKFVIIDDENDVNELSDHLLQTDGYEGLTARDIDRAVDILMK